MPQTPGRSIQGRVLLFALIACLLSPAAYADAPAGAALESESPVAAEPCAEEETSSSATETEGLPGGSRPGLGTVALKDAGYVLGAPLRWTGKDWLIVSGAAAGIVAVGFAADNRVRDSVQRHKSRTLDDLTKVVEPFGAGYSYAVIGAYGIAGYLFHDPEARDIAIDSAMASILAGGILSPVFKGVIGRARPNQEEGTTSFHSLRGGYNALPSGHATEAFAVASVISAHSDKVWVSVAAYTLAGLVGFSRIYHDAHWSSDVAAGAVIGTAVGRGLVAINRKLRASETPVRVGFAPIFGEHERGAGISIRY
jgi:membrane-associated phospholipid phosphatase